MTKRNTHPQRGKPVLLRFEEKFVRGDAEDCWEWQSAIGHRGYGAFYISKERKCEGAHRYALELKLGHVIPDGMVAMHSCDNPKCVNPNHLSLGTGTDNIRDAKAKGRIAAGERNGGGKKLTAEEVRIIFTSRFVSNGNQTARRFGVARQIVNSIRRGSLWGVVTQGMQDG